jgi:hypothetical protein
MPFRAQYSCSPVLPITPVSLSAEGWKSGNALETPSIGHTQLPATPSPPRAQAVAPSGGRRRAGAEGQTQRLVGVQPRALEALLARLATGGPMHWPCCLLGEKGDSERQPRVADRPDRVWADVGGYLAISDFVPTLGTPRRQGLRLCVRWASKTAGVMQPL